MVDAVNSKNFEAEVLKSNTPVLVDFYADWCPPCKALSPTLDNLAAELKGQLRIVKVNVDESRDLAAKFNIRSIPTMHLYNNGALLGEQRGNMPQQSIRSWMEKSLGQKFGPAPK